MEKRGHVVRWVFSPFPFWNGFYLAHKTEFKGLYCPQVQSFPPSFLGPLLIFYVLLTDFLLERQL